MHNNFLLTSAPHVTALTLGVNESLRDRTEFRREGTAYHRVRGSPLVLVVLGCGGFIAQLNMPVNRHGRLPADARLDDINLVARLQKFFGLIFNRLRGFHCRRLLSLGWRSCGLAYHDYYLLNGKAGQYTQKWPQLLAKQPKSQMAPPNY